MSHHHETDLLAAYLDGEVTADERRRIDSHLAGCQECRRELEALRTAQDALRQALHSKASDAAPPPQAWAHFQLGIEHERPSFLFLFRRKKWRVIATIIFAIIVVTFTALWLTGILPGLR